VKTASDTRAVQIVTRLDVIPATSRHRLGARRAERKLLEAVAQRRSAAGQGKLDLGLSLPNRSSLWLTIHGCAASGDTANAA
jgi:hypothetical protein